MATAVVDRTDASDDAQPLRDEARLGGIRGGPTLDAVDRRRSQLWTLVFAGLVALAAGIALLASGTVGDLGSAGTLPFRIGTNVLVVALALFVVEKEMHLLRLSQLLIAEGVSAATMHER